MGSGGSKGQTAKVEEVSSSSSSDIENDFQTEMAKKRRESLAKELRRRESIRQENKKRNAIKIVGQDDSDDEHETNHDNKSTNKTIENNDLNRKNDKRDMKKGAYKEDRLLKNDIDELEKTLDDVEQKTDSNRRQSHDLFRERPKNNTAMTLPRQSEFSYLNSNKRGLNENRGKGKAIKFSWEQEQERLPNERDSAEWTYKQTAIEGFDANKFREANRKRNLGAESALMPTLSHVDVPGAVPAYDINEEHMLNALEKELGVL